MDEYWKAMRREREMDQLWADSFQNNKNLAVFERHKPVLTEDDREFLASCNVRWEEEK